MNLDSIKTQIENLEAQLHEWSKPIDQVMQASFARVNRGGHTVNNYQREVEQIRQAQLNKRNIYQEIQEFHNQLMPTYLSATAPEREQIRAFYRKKRGMQSTLLGCAYHFADQIKSPTDTAALRFGLAAISIEDFSVDYRDTLLALAELCVTAERAGVNPCPIFEEVADLSSAQISTGGTQNTTSEILREFQNYAVLAERRGIKARKNTL